MILSVVLSEAMTLLMALWEPQSKILTNSSRSFIFSFSLSLSLSLCKQTLADGNKVNFAGFGTFEPRFRKAREGRNPKTGEKLEIPASIGAGFSAAKALKEKLNDK